ncbi:peptidoglycan/LPS O-acetylase OafA/YrhL [Arthrobacter ulcerisalmonis]|uniref:acyltransferase family protein n=1 Tax=Arthrobacter sp. B1I2 TaxID=3042263 RepID=UPI002780B2E3|nr:MULTISPECIES: acyltransferase [Arthrobacter]MDQ0662296.1 peptidoglycan/LPS O-acetylase OafA/YrhL [Arthrobacter ulcerisalmonis]MDQ0730224.1 peptidoglycan/LPS O-acetylase OafA/YrhL [Arthrobacter sp. B1I2]
MRMPTVFSRFSTALIVEAPVTSSIKPSKSMLIPQGLQYFPALDGLRAVAILLVLVHHGLQPLPFAGFLGVDIFFALSGFLITTILLAELNRHHRIRLGLFYWRRAIRLYPALLIAIVAILPFGLLIRGSKHLFEVALAATYLTPVAGQFFGKSGLTWLQTWSLGIEEIFYLVWPFTLIVLFSRRVPAKWIMSLALGIILDGAQVWLASTGQDASYFLRAGGLFLGCSFALWLSQHRDVRVAPSWGYVGVLVLSVGVVVAGVWPAFSSLAYVAAAAGTVAIIASIVAGTRSRFALKSVLSVPPVVYIGKISYELYIWHYPVAILFMLAIGTNQLINVGWYAIPASAVLAVLTHHALLKPAARWKTKFS